LGEDRDKGKGVWLNKWLNYSSHLFNLSKLW
jgi:hypothetical protein